MPIGADVADSHALELKANAHVDATRDVTLAEKRAFVKHSLKVLFQCEYHVLVEYVDCHPDGLLHIRGRPMSTTQCRILL